MRLVTNKKVGLGELVEISRERKQNRATCIWEEIIEACLTEEVIEERPARGDWTNWPEHPTFYHFRVNPQKVQTIA